MPIHNVDLPEHYHEFVKSEVSEGRFRDDSEVVRAGLALLEKQKQQDEAKLALLRKLASEAIDQLDRGEGIRLNSNEELAHFIRDLGKRAAKKVKRRGV